MSVHKKLMQARIRLQQTELKKSGINKFSNYLYFTLADFLPEVNNIFADIGLCGVISFGKEEATLTITDVEDNSQIQITSPMAEANLKGCHPIQNVGAVETYTRRYLWVTAMEIVEHDALDLTTVTDEGIKKKGNAPTISPRGGIGDDLPDDQKEFLVELAQSVSALVAADKAKEALAMVTENQLDEVQQVWMWGRLDSKVRTALKKAKSE